MSKLNVDWPIIAREKYLRQLRDGRDMPFIKVLTGIRRSGKSTILEMFMEELRESGVPEGDILYIDFDEDPDALPGDSAGLTSYVRERIVPGRRRYLFFDEIQNVDGWENSVISFYDAGADVYITGSNSHMLSSDISTKISGRSLEIHVMPLVFSEYVMFRERSGRTADELFSDFLRDGGMPAVAMSEDLPSRALIPQILDGMYGTVYRRDIEERYSIRGSSVMSNIIRFLMRNIGNRTSPRNIAGSLSSRRMRISAPTVQDYLGYITDAYLMTRSERMDSSTMEYLETTDKFYATDLGVRNAIAPMRDGDLAGLMENIVFNELRYRYGTVVTFDVDGREIDFVADPMGRRMYFQVCMSLADDATRERELRPLRSVSDNYPKTVVTWDRYPVDDIEGIRVVRLLDWLLGGD
mgnify:CR=1 FL=1